MTTPCVFYPFGSAREGEFAVTEEDTLEFLFELMNNANRFENLFAALQRSHLLFLGCNFPDWLTRFWIRALTGKRIQSPRETLEVIADRYVRDDANLVLFLKRTEIQVFGEGDAADFVSTLHAKWMEREGAAPQAAPNGRAVRRQVFVSFASEDRDAAQSVVKRLQQQGLDVWFDADDMRRGEQIIDQQRIAIERALVFVPILSHTAAARRQGYYRDEWTTAVEVSKRIGPQYPYLYPVIVDDVAPDNEGIPEAFRTVMSERALRGETPRTFNERVRDAVRKAQL
jgi:hypothetical protein